MTYYFVMEVDHPRNQYNSNTAYSNVWKFLLNVKKNPKIFSRVSPYTHLQQYASIGSVSGLVLYDSNVIDKTNDSQVDADKCL